MSTKVDCDNKIYNAVRDLMSRYPDYFLLSHQGTILIEASAQGSVEFEEGNEKFNIAVSLQRTPDGRGEDRVLIRREGDHWHEGGVSYRLSVLEHQGSQIVTSQFAETTIYPEGALYLIDNIRLSPPIQQGPTLKDLEAFRNRQIRGLIG